MSAETEMVETVRAVYEAFNRDGATAASSLLQPAATFSEPPVSACRTLDSTLGPAP